MVTGLRRLRLKLAAAWFGVLAMSLNALVPVHLAFDLVDALPGPHAQHTHSGHEHSFRAILGALAGHHDHSGESSGHHNHHSDCLVCNALGTLGAFAAPTLAALPLPPATDAPAPAATFDAAPRSAAPTPYFVRGPPLV